MSASHETNLYPEKPTIKIGTFDRLTGKLLKARLDRPPESEAEKDLAADAFFMALKPNPQTVEVAPSDRSVNKALMDWAKDSGNTGTAGNIAASLISSSIMWSTLTNDSVIQEALKKQAEAEARQKEAEELEKQATEEAAQTPQGMPLPQGVKDKLDKAKKARQQAEALADEASQKIEDASKHPIKKQVMAKAVEKAKQAGDEAKEAMASWGIEPGDSSTQDVDEILKLVENASMNHVSKVLGRLRGMATSTIKGYKQTNTGAVSQVGATKDVTKMFMSEVVKLNRKAPPIVRANKIREMASQGLMGWIPLEEQKESGSFIFIVDESGSIGTKTCLYEKAMAIAIAKSIQDELEAGRRYELYGFDTKIVTSVTSDEDWRQHIAFMREYSGGGTRIALALNHAIDRAEVMHLSGIEGVDIVLVSDGLDDIGDQVLDRLDDLNTRIGVRLFYIHIGSYSWSEELEKRAYATWRISDSSTFTGMVEQLTKEVCKMVATR